MGTEIERKFLLASDAWRAASSAGTHMMQGYLSSEGATVRVRLTDHQAFLTLKGRPVGLARSEFEYEIPPDDARAILKELTVGQTVEKIRRTVPGGNGLVWEIDEYLGANAPLFTAEIELPTPDTEFERPAWLGPEISGDGRYTNRALSRFPYGAWRAPAAPEE